MQRESNLSFLYGIVLATIASIFLVCVSAFGDTGREPMSLDLSNQFSSDLSYEVWAASTEPELVTYIEVEYTWGTQTLGPFTNENLASHSYFKQIDSILLDPDFVDTHSYQAERDPEWMLIRSFEDIFAAYDWALEIEAAFELQTKVVTVTQIVEHRDERVAAAEMLRDGKHFDYSRGPSNRVRDPNRSPILVD